MMTKTNLEKSVKIFLLVTIIEGLIVLVSMAMIPPDPKNAMLLGFSAQRLGLMALIFFFLALFIFFLIDTIRRPQSVHNIIDRLLRRPTLFKILQWLIGIGFLTGWVLSFLPAGRTGTFQPYFERLQPLIVWWMLICGQMLILLSAVCKKISTREWLQKRLSERPLWLPATIAFAVMLILWLAIALTRIGLNPDTTFWNQAVTPVTGIQFLGGWFAAFLLWRFETRSAEKHHWKLDLAISLAVWLLAVLLWTNTPFKGDFFVTTPHEPNFEYYPASDAMRFDLSAQYALIGQRYSNAQNVSRPLFTFFITAVYTLFGNDIDTLVNAQIWSFALIPILLYWIGKQLRSRSAGFFAALMLVFIESNAIFTSRIAQRTNAHLLMTELPALLLLAAMTLLLLRWMEKPDQRWTAAAAAGSLLGLSTLVRNNTWALLPAVIVFVFAAFWKQRRVRWFFTLWFMAGLIAAVTPWMVRSGIQNNNPFYSLIPAKYVVWGNRYTPLLEEQPASNNPIVTPPPGESSSQTQTDDTTPDSGIVSKAETLMDVVIRHFSHNLVTSSLAFPMQFSLDDIEQVMTPPDSFWDINWQGKVTPENTIFIFLTLAGIALGIGAGWSVRGAAAILPLLVFLAYNGGTAVARTSGGRYLIPIEWVLPFYLAFGVMTLSAWGADRLTGNSPRHQLETASSNASPSQRWIKPVKICMAFLAFAAFVATADLLYPPKYTADPNMQSFERMMDIPELADLQKIQAFTTSDQAVAMEGTALYPMYLKANDFEPTLSRYIPQGKYPVMIFSLIGPFPSQQVVLPLSVIPALPNASQVWVAGCKQKGFIDALAVVVYYDDTSTVYLRSPLTGWQCPLPEPICELNQQCQ